MKLLILDDDAVDRQAVIRHIKKIHDNVDILEAETGRQGIDLIQSHEIDCVFADYILPDMDGIEFLKELTGDAEGLPVCPVVMLTGQGNADVMKKALHFGVQDYLVKDGMSPAAIDVAISKARMAFDLIHARKKAETQLVQSQKMEAVGKMTGGIAHDFNNLLTIIFGNIRIMDDMIAQGNLDPAELTGTIDKIKKSASRGADLVKRLLFFSRKRPLLPAVVSLQDMIKEITTLMQQALGENITIKLEFDDNTWPVFIDAGQLEHAIINMCMNARDAMPDGGDLRIRTTNIATDQEFEIAQPDIAPGDYVLLEITDTGHGMNEDVCAQIFDPFFTTKDIDKGTGLGLSVVFSLIKQSDGSIHVESAPGQGTTFKIYLPRCIKEIEQDNTSPDDTIEEQTDTSERILFVEDEPDIRELTVMLLKRDGYEVLEAENAAGALEILKRESHNIHLVFTDIAMPGQMNGLELAEKVMEMNDDIHICLTTGYTEEGLPNWKGYEKCHILKKPYNPTELSHLLKTILDTDQKETLDKAIAVQS